MGKYIPVNLRQAVREQFGNYCAYCHTAEHLTVAIYEVEHIVPVTAEGETVLSNLCLACPTCNRHKGVRQTAVDPQTDQEVQLFHPQQDVWETHFVWSEDSTELIGLTTTGRATIAALKMNRPQLIRVRRMWVKLGEHPPSFPT